MRQWRRRIARSLVIVIVVGAVVCVVLPEAVALSRRHRIVAALTAARSVRLEELPEYPEQILGQRALGATQRAWLIRAIPALVPRHGLPISLKLCFVPHHRIIARDAQGVEFALTICFTCNQARHTGSPIYDIPASGSTALRQLFRRSGIGIADPKE